MYVILVRIVYQIPKHLFESIYILYRMILFFIFVFILFFFFFFLLLYAIVYILLAARLLIYTFNYLLSISIVFNTYLLNTLTVILIGLTVRY
jgi:hypothetical protein